MQEKRKIRLLVCVPLVLTLFFICGCPVKKPECVIGGKAYCVAEGNFTGQWYDYYERALSCIEGECFEPAIADLGEAIRRRTRDQRRARTMGMHFIDYFPHREKGLAHYLLGEYEDAKAELEVSIRQYPSEKAWFYLDKTRKRLMEIEHPPVSAPAIIIDTPRIAADGAAWTRDDPVSVAGRASDTEQYVTDVTLAGNPVFMESSGKHVSFSEDLILDEGTHSIPVAAKNLLCGETERRVVIHVDRTGPVIAVGAFEPGGHIRGKVFDESGEIRVYADGRLVASGKGTTVEFDAVLGRETRTVVLTATDRLGNETEMRVDPNFRSGGPSAVLLAANRVDEMSDSGRGIAAIERTGAGHPEITLKGWADHETVFRESVRIQVDIAGDADIREFRVNSQTRPLGGIGRTVSLSHFARLRRGENVLRISVSDITGKSGEKEIVITRKTPEAFKLRHRYGLAMHPFEQSETTPESALFHHRFLEDLLSRSRFRVLVREELADMLDSMSFRDTLGTEGMGEDANAVMLGVVYGTRAGVEIAARMVDIESRETIATADVYSDSGDVRTMASLAKKLSEKFHRYLPLIDGKITGIGGKDLVIEPETWKPARGKIANGWPMIVYRNTNPGDTVRGSDSVIVCGEGSAGQFGEGTISMSAEDCAGNEIETGYRVISR